MKNRTRFSLGGICVLLAAGMLTASLGSGAAAQDRDRAMDEPVPVARENSSKIQTLPLYKLSKWATQPMAPAVYILESPGDGPIRINVVPLSGDVDLYVTDDQKRELAASSTPGTAVESVVVDLPKGKYILRVEDGPTQRVSGAEFLVMAVHAEPVSPYHDFDATLTNAGIEQAVERRFQELQIRTVRADTVTEIRRGFYVNTRDLRKWVGSEMTVTVAPAGNEPADLDLIVVGWDMDGKGTVWESRNRGMSGEELTVPVQQRFLTFVVWVEAGPGTVLPAQFKVEIR